ncbi:MAG: TetR family transcriptional regulator C-terminal domain-containing protein [Gammaproteobacteria bacterium]|nr:TetR family transcriptional regulator C-terminal domain-containing protein [Gammaproteobacteria bacterium]
MTEKTDQSIIPRPRARRKGEMTRLAIVKEARRILVDEGYENFVLRKIAKNIGIQPGNLQYYFPTKKDLIWEVLSPEISKYSGTYTEVTTNASTGSAKILATVDFLLDDIKVKSTCNIWFTIWALAPHDPEIAEIMDRWYQEYLASLAQLIKASMPNLSEQRANHVARIITALMDGMTNQIGYGKPRHDTLEGIEDEIRSTILHLVTLS